VRPELARLPRTTVFRLALGYAGGFVVLLAVLLALAYWSTARQVNEHTDEMLAKEFADLRAVNARHGISGLGAAIDRRVKDYARDGIHYLLRGPDGRTLAGDLPARSIVALPASANAMVLVEMPTGGDPEAGPSTARVLGARLAGGYSLFVGHALHLERAMLTHVLKVFSIAALTAAALILTAGAILGLGVVRRIDAVSRTAARIMAGDLTQRMPVESSGNEFNDLASILNEMLERIETLLERVREVSDNVAHDLRSPLARLRANLEITLLQPRPEAEYREAIRQAINETEDVLRTFNALLSIARAEAGPRDAGLPTIDLDAVASETVEIYEALAGERGISLRLALGPEPAPVRGDTQLLSQALCNLVDNAIKYTPRGGCIAVNVSRGAGRAAVEVADSGPGIPPDQRDHVLERFVRLDQARRLPGNGLGLSLVNAVVQYHRGHLWLENNEPGLRVRIEFPALPPAAPHPGPALLSLDSDTEAIPAARG